MPGSGARLSVARMALRDRSRRNTTDPTPATPASYVTDGERLLFVERVVTRPPAEPVVLAEDCRTLEILSFTLAEFRRLGLRLVGTKTSAANTGG